MSLRSDREGFLWVPMIAEAQLVELGSEPSLLSLPGSGLALGGVFFRELSTTFLFRWDFNIDCGFYGRFTGFGFCCILFDRLQTGSFLITFCFYLSECCHSFVHCFGYGLQLQKTGIYTVCPK